MVSFTVSFLKETEKRAYTTENVIDNSVRSNYLKREANSQNKNNWNRFLQEISVGILLKQYLLLDYSLEISMMW